MLVLLTSFLESMVIIYSNNCCHVVVVVVIVAWRDMCCCSFETTFAGGRLRRIARIGWFTGVIFATVWQATRIDIPYDERFICLNKLLSDLCYRADVMLMFYKLLSVHWVNLSKWSSLEHFEPHSSLPPPSNFYSVINSQSVNSCFTCQNLCDSTKL